MTHEIVVFKPDSNRNFPAEKKFSLTHEIHHLTHKMTHVTHKMTHDLTHEFALIRTDSSLLPNHRNYIILCFDKKKFRLFTYRFFSLFHPIIKNNIVALLSRYNLPVMAYSLCSNFITFKSVAL